jgi:hypothetical protein
MGRICGLNDQRHANLWVRIFSGVNDQLIGTVKPTTDQEQG